MRYSDLVREHVRQRAIKPARHSGMLEFSVVAGDVHKALGLSNQVPLVCQALRSRKLLQTNNIILKSESGPPSGLSTTMVFTYRFVDPPAVASQQSKRESPLRLLLGRGRDLWAEWGDGEAFLKRERMAFKANRRKPREE